MGSCVLPVGCASHWLPSQPWVWLCSGGLRSAPPSQQWGPSPAEGATCPQSRSAAARAPQPLRPSAPAALALRCLWDRIRGQYRGGCPLLALHCRKVRFALSPATRWALGGQHGAMLPGEPLAAAELSAHPLCLMPSPAQAASAPQAIQYRSKYIHTHHLHRRAPCVWAELGL